MFKIALICLALAIPTLSTVEKCYVCEYNSYMDDSTSNPKVCLENDVEKLKEHEKECAGTGTSENWQCVKVTGRVEIDEENYEFVRRACLPGNKANTTCKETKSYEIDGGLFVKKGHQCVCDNDLCNTGSTLVVSAAISGIAALVAYLY